MKIFFVDDKDHVDEDDIHVEWNDDAHDVDKDDVHVEWNDVNVDEDNIDVDNKSMKRVYVIPKDGSVRRLWWWWDDIVVVLNWSRS